MKAEMILTSELKSAKYNPKTRVEQIAPLLRSIKEFGIIVPLIVDDENNLIDGHRRLASAKKLKLEKVPVVRIDNAITKDKAFEIVNTNLKKISAKDMIYIYLNGGTVSNRVMNHIIKIEEVVGADGLKKLSNQNASYRIMDVAWRVRKYCQQGNNDTFLKRVIFWLADNSMTFPVRRAMEAKVSRDTIQKAIAVNRPLKVTYK
jgi:hypothetical protein